MLHASSSDPSAKLTRSSILSLLTDAHCHPTDDPELSSGDANGVTRLAQRLENVRLQGICAMSSCTEDQKLVRELMEEMQKRSRDTKGKWRSVGRGQGHDDKDEDEVNDRAEGPKLRPCFGYHPWYSHTISLVHPAPAREEHYQSLFLTSKSSQQMKDELETLMGQLPDPRSLQDLLEEVRTNLRAFPQALLGEVGLDRAFRIPTSREVGRDPPSGLSLCNGDPTPFHFPSSSSPCPSSTRDTGPDANLGISACSSSNQDMPKHEQNGNLHTLARRGKRLTTLSVPIRHQVEILLAQIGVAVQEGRSVSLHSVRAGEATIDLIRECCRLYNCASGRGFRDINVDLHSCTMSAEQLKELLRHHPNLFISFSTTINSRQKSLESQLAIVPPTRLLIESDWHSAGDLARRNWQMLMILAPFVVRKSIEEEVRLFPLASEERGGGEEEREIGEVEAVKQDDEDHDQEEEEGELDQEQLQVLLSAARILQENWRRFECNPASSKSRRHRRRQSKKGDESQQYRTPDWRGEEGGEDHPALAVAKKEGSIASDAVVDAQDDHSGSSDDDDNEKTDTTEMDTDTDTDTDTEEEAEWDRRMDFEDQWWKDVRAGALRKPLT